jgi:Holliday junction resolvase
MTTNNQRFSQKQEGRITKSLKQLGDEARRQMASGSMWFAKSDVVSKLFQIEAKTRAKVGAKTLTVQRDWLTKIEDEALMNGKMPALAFSFGDNVDYFTIRDRDFYTMVEELIELRERVATWERESGGVD